ncbi:hypothetical protein KF134_2252 [Lactococcus lactis subsp. lactis]|nr:hypothetical protein KF134_2252 [Lactococcus lactis subsp. lactis]
MLVLSSLVIFFFVFNKFEKQRNFTRGASFLTEQYQNQ